MKEIQRNVAIFIKLVPAVAVALLLSLASVSSGSTMQPTFCDDSRARAVVAGKVGPSIHGISLGLDVKRVESGGTLYARLLNRGVERGTYGPPFRIEHFVNSRWVKDPSSPQGPWHKVIWLLPPEKAGKCYKFDVPTDLRGGKYRFGVTVKTARGRAARTVEFRVGA